MFASLRVVALLALAVACITGLAMYLDASRKQQRKEKLQANLAKAGYAAPGQLARTLPVARPGSVRAVVKETKHDFGMISSRSVVSHTFSISNEGSEPLELKVRKLTCSCLQTDWETKQVQPGGAADFRLSLHAADANAASLIQTAILETNDPEQPEIVFEVNATIERLVWVDSSTVHFTDLQPHETRTVKVHVFSQLENLALDTPQAHPHGVSARVEPATSEAIKGAKAKSGCVLLVTCDASVHKFWGANLKFGAQHSGTEVPETYQLEIIGNRLGVVGVYGEPLNDFGEIEIGNIQAGDEKVLTYSVKARGRNRQPAIKAIRAKPEFLDVRMEPAEKVAETGLHRLVIRIPTTAPVGSYQGDSHGTVEVEFADEEYPKLSFKLQFAVFDENSP